jgi:hypothetical protein
MGTDTLQILYGKIRISLLFSPLATLPDASKGMSPKELAFHMAGQGALFWDREIDQQGRVIRADVREAGRRIWERALRLSSSILGDTADAAEILECCIERVSRHMNARQHGLFTQHTESLLLVAFRHELFFRRKKLLRMEPIGLADAIQRKENGLNLDGRLLVQMDLQKAVRRLSKRSRLVLSLRRAGYEWKEISALLQAPVRSLKSSFWRELHQVVRAPAGNGSKSAKENPKEAPSRRSAEQGSTGSDQGGEML